VSEGLAEVAGQAPRAPVAKEMDKPRASVYVHRSLGRSQQDPIVSNTAAEITATQAYFQLGGRQ
jgi:hypothetical protein